MRVIAGSARGTRLAAPPGVRVRPTADRVKEAVFSSLGDVEGQVVLDLFAGSGGLAIEALSRGAAAAVLVEVSKGVAGVARENLARAHVAERARVVAAPAARFVEAPFGGPFDLVLLDPPYDLPATQVLALLRGLQTAGALVDHAAVVLERSRRGDALPELPGWLALQRERAYGDTTVHFLTVVGEEEPE